MKATTRKTATKKPALTPVQVVRKVEQLWNQNKLDALDQYFAPSFTSEAALPNLPPGLAGAKMAHQASMQSFPDRQTKILDIFASSNKVAVRIEMTGTNKGGFAMFDVPANGNPVRIEWISIYEVRNGKITRHWGVNDGIPLLIQLGAIAPNM